MRVYRPLGLLSLALVICVVASVSAQPPGGVKTAPQIKPPNEVGKGPAAPPAKPPFDPKAGKTVNPVPGQPGTGGGTPGTGGGTTPPPLIKGDPGNWPKDINGKNLETTIKDMKSDPDPAVRETAVRALPYFGPKARELGSANLAFALTKDPDFNVRIAALDVTPTVCMAMGYLNYPDKIYEDGVNAVINLMDAEFYPIRLEAVSSVTGFGTPAKVIAPRIVAKLIAQTKVSNSWHLRRAATAGLAMYGQGVQQQEGVRPDPDSESVRALLDILLKDNCAAVRREAANSLIALGPVAASATTRWRKDLEAVIQKEKDKSVLLWSRTCLVRNDPAGPKANAVHLDGIAEVLSAKEDAGRLEACQAFGILAEDGISKLRELLGVAQSEKVPLVQAAAVAALSTMKSQAAAILPILQGLLANPVTNADVKKVVSEAVIALNKKDPAPAPMPKKN